MNPIFFGPAEQPLFGVDSLAQAAAPREEAVLFCAPIGHEYMRTHLALRLLADQLPREGFHVFRFDYTGQGDSWGRFTDATVSQWVQDIHAAAQELLAFSGLARLSLVGLRLGAALAWQAVTELPVDTLILWDPVVRGRDYLEELRHLEIAQRRLKPWAKQAAALAANEELVGFPYSPRLLSDLAALDLTEGTVPPARRFHLIGSSQRPEYQQLYEHLLAAGVQVDRQFDALPGDWDAAELFAEPMNLGPLPSALLTALAGKLP